MNLLDRLRKSIDDEREIETILLSAAGGGTQISQKELKFFTSAPIPELFARAGLKNGRVTSLTPGTPLQSTEAQNDFLTKAENEAAHIHGSFVACRAIFSERPLRGTYFWKETLRIGPCTNLTNVGKGLDWYEGSPGEPDTHLGPPFPFLLEVSVSRSPNPFLETNRLLRTLDRYQYLLTLLLTGHVKFAQWPSGRMWTILKPNDVPENHLVLPSFALTEDGRQDDFLSRNHPAAPVHDGDDYYERIWSNDSELLLPSSLSDDLAAYHSLTSHLAEKFNRACYWYATGIQSRSEPSLATVAFSTAIECLLPPLSGTSCETCRKPTGAGPTKLFNNHIKRYGTVIPELESRRSLLYGVRSALVHGTHASRIDIDVMSTQSYNSDHLPLMEIVAQRSLIKWLRDPAREEWNLESIGEDKCAEARTTIRSLCKAFRRIWND
jgi:hypothetical protein